MIQLNVTYPDRAQANDVWRGSYLRDFAQAVFSSCFEGERWILMLRAYFDRSELFKPEGVVAVAGYLSPAEGWIDFEKRWREVLSDCRIRCFHMTDFEAGQGEFLGWSKVKKLDCIKRLLGIINRTVAFGGAASVRTADYVAVPDADRKPPVYAFCATQAVVQVMRWIRDRRRSAAPVACVFELGDEGAGAITDALNSAKRRYSEFDKRLWSVSFESKMNMVPLQAADLLAYETAKQVLRNTGLDQRPIRKSLKRLLTRTEHAGIYFDAKKLRELFVGDEGASAEANV